jgi:hypothetical protein
MKVSRRNAGKLIAGSIPAYYVCSALSLADPAYFAPDNRELVWRLQASGLTAISGVTLLAGAQIKHSKTWQPLNEKHLVSKAGQVQIGIEPGSGAVLFFNKNT